MRKYTIAISLVVGGLFWWLLLWSGDIAKQDCIKSGGTFVMGTWSQVCQHK